MDKKFEVWTVFRNTGRPNAFIGMMTKSKFLEMWKENPDINIGETWTDPDGFV